MGSKAFPVNRMTCANFQRRPSLPHWVVRGESWCMVGLGATVVAAGGATSAGVADNSTTSSAGGLQVSEECRRTVVQCCRGATSHSPGLIRPLRKQFPNAGVLNVSATPGLPRLQLLREWSHGSRRRDDSLGQTVGPTPSARIIARSLTVERDSASARIALVNARECQELCVSGRRPGSILTALSRAWPKALRQVLPGARDMQPAVGHNPGLAVDLDGGRASVPAALFFRFQPDRVRLLEAEEPAQSRSGADPRCPLEHPRIDP